MTPRDTLDHATDAKGLTMRYAGAMLVVMAAASAAGCAEFDFIKWKKEVVLAKATPQNPAVECLCIWQPAEGRGVNGLPSRGFAGSIMFFTHKGTSPVEVDGDVRIYQFDNQGTADEQAKPLHQFDFAPEIWTAHLQQSMLGPSYQVFVPYMRKGNHQAECALRVRLQPKDGPVIYSEMVSVTLPGSQVESTPPAAASPSIPERPAATTIPLTKAANPAGPSAAAPSAGAAEAQARLAAAIQKGLAGSQRPTASTPANTAAAETKPAAGATSPTEERLARLEAMLTKLIESQDAVSSESEAEPLPATESPEAPRFRLAPARAASTASGEEETATTRRDVPPHDEAGPSRAMQQVAAGGDRKWWESDEGDGAPAARRPHPLRETEPSQTAQLAPASEPLADSWSE